MGNIVGFREKPILTDKLVNCGVYIFTKKILEYLPKEGNIETLTFPILASAGILGYYELSIGMERWATVNTIKDISNAEKELKLMGYRE
jgi:NDP-sugar pyrophosphorylase family protein